MDNVKENYSLLELLSKTGGGSLEVLKNQSALEMVKAL